LIFTIAVVKTVNYIFQTSIPVPSPGTGVIEERFVEDGTTVKPGMELCKLRITGR